MSCTRRTTSQVRTFQPDTAQQRYNRNLTRSLSSRRCALASDHNRVSRMPRRAGVFGRSSWNGVRRGCVRAPACFVCKQCCRPFTCFHCRDCRTCHCCDICVFSLCWWLLSDISRQKVCQAVPAHALTPAPSQRRATSTAPWHRVAAVYVACSCDEYFVVHWLPVRVLWVVLVFATALCTARVRVVSVANV